MILTAQIVLCTLAAFAFARLEFPGKNVLFALVLLQLMVMPDILLVRNYATMSALGLVDTILAIGLPYFASGFAIFLLRQTFKTVPKELDEAARVEGCSLLGLLWRVYVPLAKPTMLAFGLVSVSHHWNNFVWPLIITSSVETRPLTVGLSIFATTDSGIEWSIINAATLITSGPLLIGFLLFQRQFVQKLHARWNQVISPKGPTWNSPAWASPRDTPHSRCCATGSSTTTARSRSRISSSPT